MMVLGLVVGLVEVVVGTMAGAFVYREEGAVTARAVAAGR
jgi:hypothetical protein